MRWCGRCRRRFYLAEAAYCPYDGGRLDTPQDPEPGEDPNLGTTLLGQFHLVAPIGTGAMGTVYRAWQSGMERQVAVKLLRYDLAHDLDLRRRFLREARAAARLAHPNIVCVHLVGETDAGLPYLVMEHLAGETLDDLLEREGVLEPRRALAIARQIACALAEAHAAGVVHRDLKPANVILTTRRGTGELVKIVDFGIAKVAHGALLDGNTRLTREGTVFGTPHYIAPEQAQGAELDGRADLYSLGILLYRMLSGHLPFDGNAVAVLLAHISRKPKHLLEVAPDVDRRLAALVMRCMAKDPRERFTDAEGVAAALAALEEDDDEAAAPAVRAPSQPITRAPSQPPVSRPPALVVPTVLSGEWTAARPITVKPRRSRIALAALAVAVLSTGAGTGAAALQSAGRATSVPAPRPLSAAASRPADLLRLESAPRRSIMVSEGGYSVRALVPESLVAGEPFSLVLDVWDPDGEPLDAPFLTIARAGSSSEPAPAMSGLPGRYQHTGRFEQAGPAVLGLDLPGGGRIGLHVDVQPRPL